VAAGELITESWGRCRPAAATRSTLHPSWSPSRAPARVMRPRADSDHTECKVGRRADHAARATDQLARPHPADPPTPRRWSTRRTPHSGVAAGELITW